MMELYRKFSDCLKEEYGCKVYKIPVHLPGSCPNRDGRLGTGGCTICGEGGIGFELHAARRPLLEQIQLNKEHMREKYGAEKFIIYFQNYTSTWMEEEALFSAMEEALAEDVVEIALSTRPDTLRDSLLERLRAFQVEKAVKIVLEMGVQTVQYRLLYDMNRGHGLAEIIDGILRAKTKELTISAHVIANLPGETMLDVVETAKVLNVLGVDRVKLHSLYIPKNSAIARAYEAGEIEIIKADEYLERVIAFLQHLNPGTCVERLFARAPEKDTLFCNWGRSWRFLQNELERSMSERGSYQGEYYENQRSL